MAGCLTNVQVCPIQYLSIIVWPVVAFLRLPVLTTWLSPQHLNEGNNTGGFDLDGELLKAGMFFRAAHWELLLDRLFGMFPSDRYAGYATIRVVNPGASFFAGGCYKHSQRWR